MDILIFLKILAIMVALLINYAFVGFAFMVDIIDCKWKFWTVLVPGMGFIFLSYWALIDGLVPNIKEIFTDLKQTHKELGRVNLSPKEVEKRMNSFSQRKEKFIATIKGESSGDKSSSYKKL